MASIHERERELAGEVSSLVESALPGVDVLAVELVSPSRFTVYVDHEEGVDHALCERVTDLLRGYLDRFTVDVSSPGPDRPLRKPAHFKRVVGQRVALKTAAELAGRNRFRGRVVAACDDSVRVATDAEELDIPYEDLVRGNLIDEE